MELIAGLAFGSGQAALEAEDRSGIATVATAIATAMRRNPVQPVRWHAVRQEVVR